MRHVVTQTRCTRPEANSDKQRHTRISGNILAWNPFPKIRFSRLLNAVREQMKSTDPRKPPKMVSHSVDPSCLQNICIPANTSTDSRLDSTREVPVFTAIFCVITVLVMKRIFKKFNQLGATGSRNQKPRYPV